MAGLAGLHLMQIKERHFLVPQNMVAQVKKAKCLPASGQAVAVEAGDRRYVAAKVSFSGQTILEVDAAVATQIIAAIGAELGIDGVAAQAITGA